VDLVEQGTENQLTLISAPAGSGKTVLLRAWMATTAQRDAIALVTLVGEHANRRTFWLDVLAEAGRVCPQLSGVPVPVGGMGSLAPLKSALEELREPLVLVLDDLHKAGADEVPSDLEWLLQNVPDGLRLVVATRRDPPLRLQRLRVGGQMTEIRTGELAFTPSEASEFLAPLALPQVDVDTLWARTEGWAAGLRLAELSLRNHSNQSAFIESFAGTDRAVSDYLISEVVSSYDEDTLRFLLRTSIVDRLNGELAGALAGVPAGESSLRELERVDGFVDALDSNGTWFRYYPMFAEVLRAELRHRLPDELPTLHSAASDWFARHGQPVEATRHAVAASDWQLAAEIVGAQWLVCVVHGSGAVLRELVSEIPSEVVNGDAELALAMAGLLLEAGEIEDADELLLRAYELADELSTERRRRFDGHRALPGTSGWGRGRGSQCRAACAP
jgi:LuxR family maltose regulon positive regulatory protein